MTTNFNPMKSGITFCITTAVALLPGAFAQAQAVLTSWQVTSSTEIARVREYGGSSPVTVKDPVTTWPAAGLTNLGGGQANPAQSDVQQIWSTPVDVFVYSNDLASHIMGPWYQSGATAPYGTSNLFGRWPSSTSLIFKLNRTPTENLGTKVATGGDVAILVNGIICFNYGDALSWNGTAESAVNGLGIWNRLAYPVEGPTFDPAKAHQPDNGTYHHHSNPYGIRYQLNDNVVFTPGVGNTSLDTYSELPSGWHHSPILGWAYDGFPIYGPYGYSSAMNSASAISRMRSGFVLRNGSFGTTNLPSTGRTTLADWSADAQNNPSLDASEYGPTVSIPRPLGRYAEDYDHIADHGYTQGVDFDLDRYNGRLCVTPEYPGGTYAYFVSINSDGTPAFPNIIGGQYYGTKSAGYGRTSNPPPGPATLNFTAVQDVVRDGTLAELNYTVNPTQGATNQALGRFAMAPNSNGHVTHSSFTINLGTPTGLSNIKLQRTTVSTYTSPVQFGATQNPGAGVYNVTFNDSYTTSAQTYFWLRGDVAANASGSLDARLTTFTVTGALPASFGGNDALSNGADLLPVSLSAMKFE